ncbi:variable surface protein [Plasmodium gonderi]|uniref:Variable surface protein n=1 Tax=Plasmodium gonderi TaxID=77519 RepID=A0A1Y1JT01_PLAGO|nr:variable surface protein [Plasmodium gonderi]GAW83912.1 variable surface protein [Plasmodium gonderi]
MIHTFLLFYKSVRDFPQCKNIMDRVIQKTDTVKTSNCDIEELKHFKTSNFDVIKKCNDVQNFMSEIQNNTYNIPKESSCIYLYYWLYQENNRVNNSNEIKKIYDAVIKVFHDDLIVQCTNYKDIIIVDDEMLKFNDLLDMYTKLNNSCTQKCQCLKGCADLYIKHVQTCKKYNNTYFCKELLNLKGQYEKGMMNENCEPGVPKTLPSLQSYNIITLTLIPVFVT